MPYFCTFLFAFKDTTCSLIVRKAYLGKAVVYAPVTRENQLIPPKRSECAFFCNFTVLAIKEHLQKQNFSIMHKTTAKVYIECTVAV